MSFRLSLKFMLLLFLGVSSLGALAQQPTSVVRGLVADPDSAVIPGAIVTLTPASGKALTTQSGADGAYTIRGVSEGTYSVTVTMNGFATFVRQGVRIGATQTLTIDAKLAVQSQDQIVQVTTDTNTLSVDQDSNASATVLTGKDLDALSDDPDELSAELTALAGPSTGPNGGQIYIDGFTGGQLPPKSSILRIIINQNPMSAQYDRAGFGRILVITKPGTDKYHGSAQYNFNNSALNTSNPLISTPQPAYHTNFFFGNITAPINKKASYSAGGSYRQIEDNAIINGTIVAPSAGSTTVCAPGDESCVQTKYQAAVSVPQTRWDFTPRLDLAVTGTNALTVRYQYESNTQNNSGIGNFSLPSIASNLKSTEHTVQINDNQVVGSSFTNQFRFEFQREYSQIAALNPTSPSISVQGSFTTGGSNSVSSTNAQNHFEVMNDASLQLKKNFVRFGGRLRSTSENVTSSAGSNGSFIYSDIASYQANHPSQFSITTYNNPTTHASSVDWSLFAEDDWKVRPNLTVSYGIRYEGQNFISEAHDFAPRVSFAYGLGSAKGTPKTVLRGGFGIFYDRFTLANQMTTVQENGINQVNSLAVFTTPAAQVCSPTTVANCLASAAALGNQTYVASSNIRAPYTMQFQIGGDHQLFRGATLSINYLHTVGVHQFLSRISSPSPKQYQYISEGEFRQNQLIANFNLRNSKYYSLSGFYSLNFANGDASGASYFPTNSNNIKGDYGRTSFSTRNRVFLSGTINAPFKISLSPFIIASSGSPYNLTTGTDVNGDGVINDRPTFANGSSGRCTVKGDFNTPALGTVNYTPVPINYCTGPTQFVANLRVSRTFGFGPLTDAARARAAAQNGGPDGGGGGGRGGGGRGGPGGGGPGGGGPGGGRGGPGGGGPGGGFGSNTGHRYNLSVGAQAQNLFNYKALNNPVGILSSPVFGQSTQLAGMPFTSGSAVERLQVFLSFNF
jgi:hypothetical protein